MADRGSRIADRGLRIIALWLALLVAGVVPASAQMKVDQKVATVSAGFVRIFLLTGSVNVQGWDRDSIWIRGTAFEPPGEKLVIAPGPQGAKIALWGPDETKVKPSQLTIFVPRRSQVWIKTQSASAIVSGIEGGIDINTVSGEVTAEGKPRELYVESMGGKVNLNVRTRSIRAKTGTGDIVARGIADELTLTTVSGRIWAMETRSTQTRVESIDGNIYYSGDLSMPGRLELINHSGDIEIAIGPLASAQFGITTIDGSVRDEYGMKGKTSLGKGSKQYYFELSQNPALEVEIRNFKGATIIKKAAGK
jgi:hypothetical protein